jgi:hypothetical protein
VAFAQETVTGIDTEKKLVETDAGRILAAFGRPGFLHPGARSRGSRLPAQRPPGDKLGARNRVDAVHTTQERG